MAQPNDQVKLSRLYTDGSPIDDGPIVAYPKDVKCGYICIHPETGEECCGYKPEAVCDQTMVEYDNDLTGWYIVNAVRPDEWRNYRPVE